MYGSIVNHLLVIEGSAALLTNVFLLPDLLLLQRVAPGSLHAVDSKDVLLQDILPGETRLTDTAGVDPLLGVGEEVLLQGGLQEHPRTRRTLVPDRILLDGGRVQG